MTAPVKKAGQYNLDTFRISRYSGGPSIDLKLIVHTWELNESMSSGHLYGSATIYDAVALLDKFNDGEPLRGEEELEITYRDWFDEIPRTHRMFVYAITDVKAELEANESLYSYKIYFVSKEKFETENFMVRRAFRDTLISDNVQEIYDEFYNSDKEIFIEPTEGLQHLVVPNYSPEQTMMFFARKAYSGFNPSQLWRFFENRDRFIFATHGEIIFENQNNEIPIFLRINDADQSPDGQAILMQSILEFKHLNYVNTLKDMVDGAYYSRVTELDFLNRTVTFNDYEYLEEYSKYLFPDGPAAVRSKHEKDFVDQYMNYPRDRLVIKDYLDPENPVGPEIRPNTFYPQIYNEKRINNYHHQNEKYELKIYGSNDIVAGNLIQLYLNEIHNQHATRENDTKRSGFYLVESIKNVFHEDSYYQVLTISKSGFKGAQQ